MRLWGRRSLAEPLQPAAQHQQGSAGLIVGLHGYGSDEHQLTTLVPFDLPVTRLQPRAPHPVDPGFGWWLPDGNELAPTIGMNAAVKLVTDYLRTNQQRLEIGRQRTLLLGYSQGASLALCVAARHPEVLAGVVTGAGFLPPNVEIKESSHKLQMLVMNGSIDRVITGNNYHEETVARFSEAGHEVTARLDPVPHVISTDQASLIEQFLAERLELDHGNAPA